jgi:transcriptional regulator with XRE-family HTH domain
MKSEKSKRQPLDQAKELKKIAARLKVLRKKKGYTNMDIFAYEHGFGRAQYGRYENGQDLRFTTIVRLANCFEMDLKEFFSEGFED